MKPRWVPMAIALLCSTAFAQSPKTATYITDEQVKAIGASGGIDHQIVSVDIGKLNEAVGIIHRGKTAGPTASGDSGRGGATRGAATGEPCGEQVSSFPPDATPGGISHDHQTETYIIVSGGGTLVTGGRIVNGRKSGPDSDVTKVLNGPSCSGAIAGPEVVKRVVKTGDVIIIPSGVPHGWTDITDHVDYLSVRPDPDRVLPAGYINPGMKKP